MAKLKSCPFCRERPRIGEITRTAGINGNKWSLMHFCHISERPLDIVTTVYGATKDEVIARWNREACNDA